MDFLTFKSFISIEVLILFYYMGAFVLPIFTWFFITWIVEKYKIISITYEKGKDTFWKSLSRGQKIKLITLFLTGFFFMQLFWRMMFEFLIAYMQIHDVLVHTS